MMSDKRMAPGGAKLLFAVGVTLGVSVAPTVMAESQTSHVAGIDTGAVYGIDTGATSGIDTGAVYGIDTGATSGIDTGAVYGIDTGAVYGIDTGAVYGIDTGAVYGIDTGATSGIDTGAVYGIDTGAVYGIDTGAVYGIDTGAAAGHHVLTGPIDFIDRDARMFSSLGQTVFAGDEMLANMAVGDYIAVRGTVSGPGFLYADSIERMPSAYVAGASEVFLLGMPTSVDFSTASAEIGGIRVEYGASLSMGDHPRSGIIGFRGIRPNAGGSLITIAD